ncbi:MAG: tryptophan--tRNA ligase [Thermovirgaceae bacterium]|jgi:tryptophanyl-tRNA synthetase|nr:tryptophan--tRNA ligase [Synergistales bacterium]MDI9392128.1 tryptophan--tRNA ligase [Synergistota bacterium]MDY0179174.1 tryptophan--tRNA ligase [Synergistaceae bacterium]HRW88283.1 tryptophan--tRNA ligase [Thermovirgaceae bacterium]MDD3829554.1 tryptophan--tRNA ligase [Synergistales bacterium]
MAKRVFSGMRPTGRLHLGHLAGALFNWVRFQDEYDCYYCIVDWHAMMSDYSDTSSITSNCREVLLDWLGVGLDPDRSTIFLQSHVPQHAELHLALSMIAPLGWLERCPTYKDQILNIQNKDLSTYAFLGYPVLMAADILLYKGELVPVGEDQSAHLEISREMARRFNNFFGEVFPEPQTILTKTPKVPGTDGRKMSKSYGNSINIADSPEEIWEKLRTMMTDPARERRKDPGDPDKCPVWDIHKVFNNDMEERDRLSEGCRTAGIGCIDCKKALYSHLMGILEPVQARRRSFESSEDDMIEVLRKGARKAERVAAVTISEVIRAIGFIPR